MPHVQFKNPTKRSAPPKRGPRSIGAAGRAYQHARAAGKSPEQAFKWATGRDASTVMSPNKPASPRKSSQSRRPSGGRKLY